MNPLILMARILTTGAEVQAALKAKDVGLLSSAIADMGELGAQMIETDPKAAAEFLRSMGASMSKELAATLTAEGGVS